MGSSRTRKELPIVDQHGYFTDTQEWTFCSRGHLTLISSFQPRALHLVSFSEKQVAGSQGTQPGKGRAYDPDNQGHQRLNPLPATGLKVFTEHAQHMKSADGLQDVVLFFVHQKSSNFLSFCELLELLSHCLLMCGLDQETEPLVSVSLSEKSIKNPKVKDMTQKWLANCHIAWHVHSPW